MEGIIISIFWSVEGVDNFAEIRSSHFIYIDLSCGLVFGISDIQAGYAGGYAATVAYPTA